MGPYLHFCRSKEAEKYIGFQDFKNITFYKTKRNYACLHMWRLAARLDNADIDIKKELFLNTFEVSNLAIFFEADGAVVKTKSTMMIC